MIYKPTRAYGKIDSSARENKISVIKGGQGASKTISILMLIANECLKVPNLECSILGHEATKLKAGAGRDFVKIMKSWNRFNIDRWTNKSFYQFENGSYLEFIGLDRSDIGKGFRRDFVDFNEANRGISFETYHQVASRVRKKVFIEFNPDSPFWVDDEVIGQDNVNELTLTFEDNEHLPKEERKEIISYKTRGFHNPDLPFDKLFKDSNIKNSYWANKWRVYGLGLIGSLEGVILQNWKEIDNVPPEAKYIGTGLDFGFTNDPTAITDVYKYNQKLVLDEVEYSKGLSNKSIANILSKDFKRETVADSAEPKSIAEIKSYRENIVGAIKGADSIKFGYDLMQQQEFLITKRSRNVKQEFRNHKWDTDRNGEKTGKPKDTWNHAIDGVRYLVSRKLSNRRTSTIKSKPRVV